MYVSPISTRLVRGKSTPAIRAMIYPCLCLCFWFGQITRTTPCRRTILHLSQIRLTDALTFIASSQCALDSDRAGSIPRSLHPPRAASRSSCPCLTPGAPPLRARLPPPPDTAPSAEPRAPCRSRGDRSFRRGGGVLSRRQHLRALIGHRHGVLEVRRQAAVLR